MWSVTLIGQTTRAPSTGRHSAIKLLPSPVNPPEISLAALCVPSVSSSPHPNGPPVREVDPSVNAWTAATEVGAVKQCSGTVELVYESDDCTDHVRSRLTTVITGFRAEA